jgi:hypothetical protein
LTLQLCFGGVEIKFLHLNRRLEKPIFDSIKGTEKCLDKAVEAENLFKL